MRRFQFLQIGKMSNEKLYLFVVIFSLVAFFIIFQIFW